MTKSRKGSCRSLRICDRAKKRDETRDLPAVSGGWLTENAYGARIQQVALSRLPRNPGYIRRIVCFRAEDFQFERFEGCVTGRLGVARGHKDGRSECREQVSGHRQWIRGCCLLRRLACESHAEETPPADKHLAARTTSGGHWRRFGMVSPHNNITEQQRSAGSSFSSTLYRPTTGSNSNRPHNEKQRQGPRSRAAQVGGRGDDEQRRPKGVFNAPTRATQDPAGAGLADGRGIGGGGGGGGCEPGQIQRFSKTSGNLRRPCGARKRGHALRRGGVHHPPSNGV